MSRPSGDGQRRRSSASSGLSYLEQKFKGIRLHRSQSDVDSPGNSRGEYGLNLLHAPPEPLVDFIFVHGLRGGSVKTWRKQDDAQFFWPQRWLPFDPGLRDVRIHSFGYNSDWTDRKDSILNIHDFGRSLLGEMITSPDLRKGASTPIVLIGHSMGGLVIKKAYILAKQQANCEDLSSRIRSFFFLATPHRGSNSATLLNNILRSSGALSARPYVDDLGRNSQSLQVINDQFTHYADHVSIWSFYETLKTSIGVSSVLIVERDSAILGYKHERVQLLNANHRGVCKFDSPSDPNFQTLRKSLVAAVDELAGEVSSARDEEKRAQMRSLQAYLNVVDKPDDDLANHEEIKAGGSCFWIEERERFLHWRDFGDEELQVYWINAKPATGKSVLAAHIIMLLEQYDLDCSYYFLRHGDKGKQVLSGLLRSIAFQMALQHAPARQTLLRLQAEKVHFDKDDERAIWRKVFAGGILQVPLQRRQYWVIDALDECVNYRKLFPLLSKLESKFPLRLLITSRMSPDLDKHFTQLGKQVVWDSIYSEDTHSDIKLYLDTEMDSLEFDSHEQRQSLQEQILAKSAGCFLWVRVVLRELESIWTVEQFSTVLDEMPPEMEDMYKRTLDMMSENIREKRLAQAILIWVVLSTRPLSVAELQHALNLESGTMVRNLEKSIEALCGQLLRVDKQKNVHAIHSTAREFLLKTELASEFAVRRDHGHERLVMTCLTYLCSDDMRPPRSKRLVNHPRRAEKQALADYASTAFSEHLASSPSAVDKIMVQFQRFLRTNVLGWIEFIATQKNLYYLTRTAKNMRTYLQRRAKYVSLVSKEVQLVDGWATDLLRLVAKFGSNLLSSPSSIHFLIPPFCPVESTIYQQFGRSVHGLDVVGLSNKMWEDCISYLPYRETRATALACGVSTFALGMKSGIVYLYDQSTCQMKFTLQHGELVKLLRFEDIQNLLASSGHGKIRLWNLGGEQLWMHDLKNGGMSMNISQDASLITLVDRANGAITWECTGGALQHQCHFVETQAGGQRRTLPAPLAANVSADLTMVALVHRGKPVSVWSLENDDLIGYCDRDNSDSGQANISVQTALFNPNPDLYLLVVAYQDGDLALFDPWTQECLSTTAGEALSLACTPDGRTLATGGSTGIIQIWDFETLTLLHRINSYDLEVRSLSFSGDGLRLIDIRDTKSKVWEPSVLVRKLEDEEASLSDMAALPATIVGTREDDNLISIAAVACHPTTPAAFVGLEDGTVSVYSTTTGKQISELFSQGKNVFVTSIICSGAGFIATTGAGSAVKAWRVTQEAESSWTASTLFETRVDGPVKQILISPDGFRLLISTTTLTTLWSLNDSGAITGTLSNLGSGSSKWISSSADRDHVVLLAGSSIRSYSWDDLSERKTARCRQLNESQVDHREEIELRTLSAICNGRYLVADYHRIHGDKTTTHITVWDARPDTAPDVSPMQSKRLSAQIKCLSPKIRCVLGGVDTKLVFLDQQLWVCSIDLNAHPVESYTRHFFVPNDFLGGGGELLVQVAPDGRVVFGKDGELAVIQRGLEFEDAVALGKEE